MPPQQEVKNSKNTSKITTSKPITTPKKENSKTKQMDKIVAKNKNSSSSNNTQGYDFILGKLTQNLMGKIKKIHQNTTNEKHNDFDTYPGVLKLKSKEFFQNNKLTINQNEQPKVLLKSPSKNASLSSKGTINNSSKKSISSNNSPLVSVSSKTSRQSNIAIDYLTALKNEVQQAIRTHKTFTLRGQYPAVRRALLDRGWIEKFHSTYKDHLSQELRKYVSFSVQDLLPLLRHKDISSTCKSLIKSKLLATHQVDLYWAPNFDGFKENSDKIKMTLLNKFRRDAFSYANKQGLSDLAPRAHWYQHPGVSKMNHPRSHTLARNENIKHFIDDFHLTAAMCLLKWIVRTGDTKESKLVSGSGKVPLEVFEFAVNECCKLIKRGNHEDIDEDISEASEYEWNQFLEYFYKTVHFGNHFKDDGKETEQTLIDKATYIVDELKKFWTFVDMDGLMNIWILKPSVGSRGIGIHICRTLRYMLKTIKDNNKIRYIAQKYIERPLLVYCTKFDIRQWFLLSSSSPLTIWMYKQSYLRFSSQTYNLRKLHESIHLTNNSVQAKYKNNSHDIALPAYNMWDSKEFQNYLSNIGYPNVYRDIIYDGMKQCIVAAILMHQEKIDTRRNCFELYGADFILTEDFQPWLLEINSNPALYSSTPVTSRLCPKVLGDVIRVVVDFANNPKASTGDFELIYKGKVCSLPSIKSASLQLKGCPLDENYFCTPELLDATISENEKPTATTNKLEFTKCAEDEIKKTLTNLVQIVKGSK